MSSGRLLSIARASRGHVIRDHDGTAVMTGVCGGVELADGTYLTALEDDRTDGPLALTWYASPHGTGALALGLEIANRGSTGIRLARIDPLRGTIPCGRPGEAFLTQIGWQSWSRAGRGFRLGSLSGAGPPPMRGPELPHNRPSGTALPWAVGVGAGAHVVAGFVSAARRMGMVSIAGADAGLDLVAWEPADHEVIEPGGRLRSEKLVVASGGTEAQVWAAYGAAVAHATGRRVIDPPPTGWCSWYGLGPDISEESVARAIDRLADARLPLSVVQIDDGYQTHCGDWLAANDRFPGGLRSLARRIVAAGFRPGLWLAPFLVSERSSLFEENPHWIVRDARGEAVTVIRSWEARQFALDTTHPQALGWLREVARTVTGAWGFSYLKTDFLYAGAVAGRRWDDVGPVEAYRRGLRAIREAAGDACIVGCGAPLLPSAGLVDTMRVGPDVKPYWSVPPSTDPERGTLRDTIRSVLTHLWTHGSLWTLDPDCALLRGRGGTLTPAEVRTWLTVVAMSGGSVILGDDPEHLDSPELDLLSRLLPSVGRSARPLEPYHDGLPAGLLLSGTPLGAGWDILAVFNWTDAAAARELDLAEHGIGGPRHLFDLWDGLYHGVMRTVELDALPPHGVRLLALCAPRRHPQVVGTTFHLLGGAFDVRDEEWADHTLTVRLECAGRRTGQLVVAADGYAVRDAGSAGDVRAAAGLITLTLRFTDSAVVSLALQPVP